MYDALQPRKCTTCLSAGNHRSCPQPDIVRKHLHERTGFLGEIQVQDQVCLVCYRSHFVLLRDNTPISTNSGLICEYVHNIPTIAKVLTIQDVVDSSYKESRIAYILYSQCFLHSRSSHGSYSSLGSCSSHGSCVSLGYHGSLGSCGSLGFPRFLGFP